jgi:hypothetical protein
LEKIAFRTVKEVGRSVSYIHIYSIHVFLDAVKSIDLISLTRTRLLGPEFGRGILGPDLDAAFCSWNWMRLFWALKWTWLFGPGLGRCFSGLDLDAPLGPVLGRTFLGLHLEASFWAWTWTRLYGNGIGRCFLVLDLEALFWAWELILFASRKTCFERNLR